jgi:CheY-like chemotaxis protein
MNESNSSKVSSDVSLGQEWQKEDESVPQLGRPRVLVVDDHAEMRFRMIEALAQVSDIVGTAADGPSALGAVASLKPDVVVLDVSMPEMSGLEPVSG